MKVKIRTEVKDGRLLHNRNSIEEAVKQYEGKEITITIEKAKKSRSNPQNKYYWGVVVPLIKKGLFDATADVYSNQTTHEMLRFRFLTQDKHVKDGMFIQHTGSTSSLSTFEMEEYLELCRRFAQEYLNIIIELPNEQAMMNFE